MNEAGRCVAILWNLSRDLSFGGMHRKAMIKEHEPIDTNEGADGSRDTGVRTGMLRHLPHVARHPRPVVAGAGVNRWEIPAG